MENPCTSAEINLQILSGNELLEKAKKSCVALLHYRLKHHVKKVEETIGDNEIWRLVLRDSPVDKEPSSVNTTILCSGREKNTSDASSDECSIPATILIKKDVYDKLQNSESRFSADLVLVKFQQESKYIYYVLSDYKNKVINATSVEELECHGKILFISNGQDPPEAISCEILKSYFGNNKKPCSKLDKCYIQIVENGNVEKLKKAILDEAAIKCAIDENGWTLLHHASHHRNLKILPFLISMGCDVHAQDNICGRKPFIIAAREGHTDIIKFFFDQDESVNVNEADSMGWTLLHYAAWKGDLDTVRFLIKKKAQMNVKDKCSGKTPLHVATEEGHLDVVQLFVSSGLSIEEETNDGMTPLCKAVIKGFLHIVAFLFERCQRRIQAKEKLYALLEYAVNEGHLHIVEFLVDKGANYDQHILNMAVIGHCLNIAKFLVDKRADVVLEDAGKTRTPLHYAACSKRLDIVEFLVLRGANLNAEDIIGMTPLHFAAKYERLEIAEFLVLRGANLNAEDENGMTPLHFAAQYGYLAIAEFLVLRGANLNSTDKDGNTPLHIATSRNRLAIVEFLARKGANLHAINEEGETPLVCEVEHVLACKIIFILQNQGKAADVVQFYKKLLELRKNELGIVPPETFPSHRKLGEILLLIEDDEVLQNIFKEIAVVLEAYLSTNHCIATQQGIALIPEQNEIVENVKDNINENEAPVGNDKINAYTQTDGRGIHDIFFWLMLVIIYLYAIFCFFSCHNISN